MIIAVDFDGTLCESAWPEIGEANTDVIEELKRRKAGGDKVILWTCRVGSMLEDAVAWCKAMGIELDAVNENLPEKIAQYGNNCRKVSADEYWDDKSVIVAKGTIAKNEGSYEEPLLYGDVFVTVDEGEGEEIEWA